MAIAQNTIAVTLLFFSGITFSSGQLHLENLGDEISRQVQRSLEPLQDLDSRINENVHNSLKSLDGLGARIEQQVYQSLEPVRVLEAQEKIKHGNGGTTVATFSPSGQVLIIRENIFYECSGTISEQDGGCSGTLREKDFTGNESFCFKSSKAIVNDRICVASTGISVAFVNGVIRCDSSDGKPTLLMTVADFNKMCASVATKVKYQFFASRPFKNPGNKLDCHGNPPVCSLEQDLNVSSTGSNIIINGSGSYVNL